jgi:prepilin-type N-terminal cleavage/methylation domain-containing protein
VNMHCLPLSTTTRMKRTRGFTLLELVISTSLFLLMSTALLSLFSQSRRATDKAVESTDTTSTMLLLFEHLRNETKGVRIVGTLGDRLEYWKIRSVGGVPQLTPIKRVDYEPGYPQAPDPAFLYMNSDGLLLSEFQGKTRRLARAGPGSTLRFIWSAATHTLTLTGEVVTGENREEFIYTIYVSNNE